MASYCKIEQFHISRNQKFIEIAERLKPNLYHKRIKPQSVHIKGRAEGEIEFRADNMAEIADIGLKEADEVVFDFGTHYVGYLLMELGSLGSHPDAPAYIYLRFAERIEEFEEKTTDYNGWIGRGWIQEEYIHMDVLPGTLRLERRYAFRYLKIKVLGVSEKYSLTVHQTILDAVSAIDFSLEPSFETRDRKLKEMDQVGLRTLRNCMQDVFEDGPKRDRRMWLGDLRLQACTNYETFQNYELVKRSLYLFGGLTFNEGMIAACLFTQPEYEPDDTYLFDYALFYVVTLCEYFEAAKDKETLHDLYPIAMKQVEIGLSYLDEEGVVPDHSGEFWCFVDWGESLNTQAASLAILIYSLRYAIRLAEYSKDAEKVKTLRQWEGELKKNARKKFWDDNRQFFVSGKDNQISWASQIWMILADVLEKEESHQLILRTRNGNPECAMVSPYMYHYYIEALLKVGENELAQEEMVQYWGSMVQKQADTYWEIYNPHNPSESPYGSAVVNSYCHAWSCTPSYFLRRLGK